MRMGMRRLAAGVAVAALAAALAGPAVAVEPEDGRVDRLAELKLDQPVSSDTKIERSLLGAAGVQTVIVRLTEKPVATGGKAQKPKVAAQQAKVVRSLKALDKGARQIATTKVALNAVFVRADAEALVELAADPNVVSINRVRNYELDLSETVPYIGGSAVQAAGFDGTGVKVAVLDSGIDYTHAALGGSGNPADFAGNDPTVIEAGTFPTAKVVAGYDFVGSDWPNTPEAPDPDPIDDGPDGGHGTHVADIIAGAQGVAPGASLYAVKVCSSVSTACSGIALIQGMDFALDPNGDGDLSDKADVINMSLGSNYGQAFDDDLSQAVENATKAGVLTVASSGNSSDKPYVTGSPAAAPSALSVAQTSVPSAVQLFLRIDAPAPSAGLYPAVFQPWSAPLTAAVTAPLQYGDGAGGNLNGCAAFPAGSLAGKIVLVDRGACNFTLKVANVANAGGLIGIIGLIAPGDPFEGGDGGDPGSNLIPGFMISQALSNILKSEVAGQAGRTVSFDPADGAPLVGTLVGSSSRGPAMLTNIVKPEIGAPGASVSAIAGTGTGTGPFGGTSGAAPMVAGSAALLKDAYPGRSPAEIKAVLMNTAETKIYNSLDGPLAPITRIGGGEVRVDRALTSTGAAWDAKALSGAISFGFVDASKATTVITKKVTVRNYSRSAVTYRIKPTFRYEDDALLGALKVNTPPTVRVPARGTATFPVTLQVKGAALRDWLGNSGSQGASPAWLTAMELDGYLELTAPKVNPIHVAWHALPRKSGDVRLGGASISNVGVGTTLVEAYSLLGTSPNQPSGPAGGQNPVPDLRYAGYATIPVPAGFCSANPSFLLLLAANTWERQTHANAPASISFFLDTNRDGTDDYEIFTFDLAGSALSDGRNAVYAANLATGASSIFFFTDHDTNSGNTVLTICGEQIGMNAATAAPIGVTPAIYDMYFTGTYTDVMDPAVLDPRAQAYNAVFGGTSLGAVELAPKATTSVEVVTDPTSEAVEQGVLLLYRGGAPAANEAGTIMP